MMSEESMYRGYQENKYDADHDVMHVFLGSQAYSSSEEVRKNIFVTRNDDTEAIVGFTILNFKGRNQMLVQALYPQFDFSIGYHCKGD